MNRFIRAHYDKGLSTEYTKCFNRPLLPLAEALKSVTLQSHISSSDINHAKMYCWFPSHHGLTKDESAAIYLYANENYKPILHRSLNRALQSGKVSMIEIWLDYLRLFNTALKKLPTVDSIVWCGMYIDIAENLRKDQQILWGSVSSCSLSKSVIESYLDSNCALCAIKSLSGRNIYGYSYYSGENEVILLPGTRLCVKDKQRDPILNKYILYLEEIKPIHTSNGATNDSSESVSSKYPYTSQIKVLIVDPQDNTDVHKSRKEIIMSATDFENGDRYEVAYKDGKKHGSGMYIQGERVTEGDSADYRADGKGVRTWENGDRYEGDIKSGKMSGFGILYHAAGKKYEGYWIADEPYGQGTTTFPDGTSCEGFHRNGKIEERGKFWSPSGDEYEGGLLDNKAHGKGIRIWKNGDRYEGYFMNDKKHGRGTYIYANGGTYNGLWQNDEMNGHGTLVWPSGTRYAGTFKDGKKHGRGVLTLSNGSVINGFWENDVHKS